jgi:predicted dehydrogenase
VKLILAVEKTAVKYEERKDVLVKELRIGIIGTGGIVGRHMTVWSKIPGTKVVAGCDIDRAKLDAWGERYGIASENRYTNFRELLKRDDIDCVDVCVHNNLHTPIALEVMKAGKGCYSEKPMAGSYVDAKRLYDGQKIYGAKLAIQISSIYNLQTRLAKKLIEEGKLGKIYHARSVGHRREGRPGVDMPLSPSFISKEMGGRGPVYDLGVYHFAQLLYVLGMPELESIYGAVSADYYLDQRLLKPGLKFEVEDLGVALARFKGGLSIDLYEDWALNMDEVGNTLIAGSVGGLKLIDVDSSGGKLAQNVAPGQGSFDFVQKPDLEFFGYEDGLKISKKFNCLENMELEEKVNPRMALYNDNQRHWAAYMRGELTDETRIDSPYIALQTALLSEGIFLSDKLGRSVTADEIKAMSESTAIRKQVTDWGTFEYDF